MITGLQSLVRYGAFNNEVLNMKKSSEQWGTQYFNMNTSSEQWSTQYFNMNTMFKFAHDLSIQIFLHIDI